MPPLWGVLRQFVARWKAALVGLAVIGISLILVRRRGNIAVRLQWQDRRRRKGRKCP